MIQYSVLRGESEERTSPRARGGRQIIGGVTPGDCEVTGYEVRVRQDCQVVTETACANVTVARFNKTIEQTCTTRVSRDVREGHRVYHSCTDRPEVFT